MSEETGVVIVTGGGTGMGRAIALDQAVLHPVIVVGRRPEPLVETAALDAAGRIEAVAADVATVDGVETVRAALAGRPVDGIVAAAGGQGEFKDVGASLSDIEAAWHAALDKNLFSAVLLIEGLLAELRDATARIVLISSTSSMDGRGGPYATAKAALNGYGRDLALRVAHRGITVNTVAPGFVADTEFFDAGGYGPVGPMAEYTGKTLPLKRVGTCADITGLVRWLLSPDAGWTTGQVISPNGGAVLVQ